MSTQRNEPANHPPRWGFTNPSSGRQFSVYAPDKGTAVAILNEAWALVPGEYVQRSEVYPLPALLDERPVVQEGRVTHVTEPSK